MQYQRHRQVSFPLDRPAIVEHHANGKQEEVVDLRSVTVASSDAARMGVWLRYILLSWAWAGRRGLTVRRSGDKPVPIDVHKRRESLNRE